jgi:hypothetical protein
MWFHPHIMTYLYDNLRIDHRFHLRLDENHQNIY